jgi:hypothetical protein
MRPSWQARFRKEGLLIRQLATVFRKASLSSIPSYIILIINTKILTTGIWALVIMFGIRGKFPFTCTVDFWLSKLSLSIWRVRFAFRCAFHDKVFPPFAAPWDGCCRNRSKSERLSSFWEAFQCSFTVDSQGRWPHWSRQSLQTSSPSEELEYCFALSESHGGQQPKPSFIQPSSQSFRTQRNDCSRTRVLRFGLGVDRGWRSFGDINRLGRLDHCR